MPSSAKSVSHFLVRFLGLTGLMVAIVGLVLWQVAEEPLGEIITYCGAALFGLYVLVDLAVFVRLSFSRRGAMGFNVGLQVLLAAALFVGVNVFSFFHHVRWDWTSNGEFTLDPQLR